MTGLEYSLEYRGIFPAGDIHSAWDSSAPRLDSRMGRTSLQPLETKTGRNSDTRSENRSVRTFGATFIHLERVLTDRPAAL